MGSRFRLNYLINTKKDTRGVLFYVWWNRRVSKAKRLVTVLPKRSQQSKELEERRSDAYLQFPNPERFRRSLSPIRSARSTGICLALQGFPGGKAASQCFAPDSHSKTCFTYIKDKCFASHSKDVRASSIPTPIPPKEKSTA